ncbi:DUF1631 domain-containing protein [Simiduia agarivorans]|uniref:Thymidine phosphorylase n=1 Tax=Simiduia agarivorans (strain DSM 21679 / JCM 13881 / BCRC 17597 / SA1) TaxID=1117647 RepID=K4KR36_SIMAS|nr:DUF1631 domain-containing protein [Simiduia agarivorans]AFV00716.1 hypothetical protein M5M_17935 [Simiduia agarivorans SA1 = DSM 21679]
MSSGSTGAKVVPLKSDQAPDARRIERALLARLPAPVHAVQQKGKQVLAGLLRTLFDKADDSLFELADRAANNQDQNLYFESMREVRLKRRAVETQFADEIDSAFARLANPDAAAAENQEDDTEFSMDNLSLVQNDELEELVATDSMINKANERFAENIQHLALRLDNLVPVKVYQKNNPLGPDALCNSFVAATGCMTLDIKARLVLFKLFDRLVVTQLGKLYDEANKVLIEHNVLPSLKAQIRQNRRQAVQRTSPAVSAGGYMGGGDQSDAAVDGETLNSLQQLLAEHRGDAPDRLNPEFNGPTIGTNDVMRVLSQLQQRELSGGKRNLNSVLDHVLRAREDGRRLGQLDDDVINLVNMMFEFILDDRNLAAPMKALLGRLQIPLLKVAIADKSFFNKGGHPARRLLNELATAALGWAGDGGEKDGLYRKIDGIVQRLITDFESDISIFNELLADFVSFVEREKRRATLLEQRTLDAEDGKARSERARALVAQTLDGLMLGRDLDPAVEKLLKEAWGNVLFLVCLKHDTDSEEWREALQTAADLVWSVSANLDKQSRARLLQLVPDLLKRLRAGLESVSYNPFEMTQLFKQLQVVHLARLKAPVPAVAPAPEPVPAQPAAAVDVPAVSETVTPATPVAETPQVIVENLIARQEEVEPPAPAAPAEDNAFMAQVLRMSPGSWFEMVDDDQRFRCRLAAIIKATGKYIFVNRAGMKVAEKTAADCAADLRSGKLQTLDDGQLFDRALEAVIGNLRSSRGR